MTKRTLWPYAVTAAYTAFFLGMASLVVFAIRNPSDLVSKDYYKQEIEHQQRIDSERRANNDPGAPTITVQGRQCVIHYPGVPPESGTITLYRPSDAKLDLSFPLALDTAGRQVVDLADFQRGLWRLRAEWTRNSENHFKEEVLTLN